MLATIDGAFNTIEGWDFNWMISACLPVVVSELVEHHHNAGTKSSMKMAHHVNPCDASGCTVWNHTHFTSQTYWKKALLCGWCIWWWWWWWWWELETSAPERLSHGTASIPWRRFQKFGSKGNEWHEATFWCVNEIMGTNCQNNIENSGKHDRSWNTCYTLPVQNYINTTNNQKHNELYMSCIIGFI